MDKVTFIVMDNLNGTTSEHAIIDRGDGGITAMLKSTWDELQAKQSEGGLK